ncbi:MAG TPA: hypothetical protein VGL99_07870 [Chloroflexota bacterium]
MRSGGAMLNDSRPDLRSAPGLGIALALLLSGLNFLSDALHDAFDPRRTNA